MVCPRLKTRTYPRKSMLNKWIFTVQWSHHHRRPKVIKPTQKGGLMLSGKCDGKIKWTDSESNVDVSVACRKPEKNMIIWMLKCEHEKKATSADMLVRCILVLASDSSVLIKDHNGSPDYSNKIMEGFVNIQWRVLGTSFYIWNLENKSPVKCCK